jgi:hypothetical protein
VSADLAPAPNPPQRRTTPTSPLNGEPELEEVFGSAASPLGGQPTPPESFDFSTAPTPVTGTPAVSPTRRQTGTIIAVVLLVALVVTAVWFVVRTAERVTPAVDSSRTHPTNPAPTPAPRG